MVGIGAQQTVVGGDVGLAFAGVGDEGIHIAHGGQGLDVAGEGSAAHAHDTGLPDGVEDLIVGGGDYRGDGLVPEIVVDDDGVRHPAIGVRPGLDGGDGAGDGGVDGDAQTLAVADLLAPQDPVADAYQGFAGRADVLDQRDHHPLRGDGVKGRHRGGHFFIVFGVDSAKKQVFHLVFHLMF